MSDEPGCEECGYPTSFCTCLVGDWPENQEVCENCPDVVAECTCDHNPI